LSRREAQNLLAMVDSNWKLVPKSSDDVPSEVARDFFHDNMMDGAEFVKKIAAVGTINNHYPSILLERRLLPKAWQVVTRVTCRTPTLKGLSYNDFHIAMVRVLCVCKDDCTAVLYIPTRIIL
jgi:pterin-4a-carbinolamine dehydratase